MRDGLCPAAAIDYAVGSMAETAAAAPLDEQIERPDGRVELTEGVTLDDPALSAF